MTKLKVATTSLAGCFGCHMSFLDIDERLLDLVELVEFDRSPLTETDGRPYSGCYVVAIVELWAQDNSWGKRVNATLKGVQFFADGEAFSGGTPASAGDFDDLGAFDEAMA